MSMYTDGIVAEILTPNNHRNLSWKGHTNLVLVPTDPKHTGRSG